MFDVTWLLFIVASLVLIVTPGQVMILVMPSSVAQGSAAGVATAAGVSVGLVGHTVLGPVGLAAGRLSGWLRSRPEVPRWLYRTSGAVLIGLGLKLAFERR